MPSQNRPGDKYFIAAMQPLQNCGKRQEMGNIFLIMYNSGWYYRVKKLNYLFNILYDGMVVVAF